MLFHSLYSYFDEQKETQIESTQGDKRGGGLERKRIGNHDRTV